MSKCEQSQHHTCLHAGLGDAYNCSPQHILSYGEVVVSVFEHRWRHQACHHADVDSGIGEGNQTTTILGRDYHRNNRIGFPKNGPRQGDHTCKFKTTGMFQRGVFWSLLINQARKYCYRMGETVKGKKSISNTVCVCVRTVKVLMPTCVFVERKVRRGPSRCCFVCNSAILA